MPSPYTSENADALHMSEKAYTHIPPILGQLYIFTTELFLSSTVKIRS